MSTEPVIKVSIIEDDTGVAGHLKKILSAGSGYEIKDCLDTGKAGVERIIAAPPDLAIIDLGLPDMHGSECVRAIKKSLPDLKVMVFTIFEDEENIIRAIRAGADGYVLKDTPRDLFLMDLKVVLMGGATLTARVAHRMVGLFKAEQDIESPLTKRESEVLHLIALGYKYSDIADELDISPSTVRGYIENIYRKLDVHSRSEAIVKGRRSGFLKNLFD